DQGLRMMNVVLELEPLENRDGKRRGLAGAGAGLADDVDFLERKGNQPGLNGRGIFITGLIESAEHDVREAEAVKGGLRGLAVLQNRIPDGITSEPMSHGKYL